MTQYRSDSNTLLPTNSSSAETLTLAMLAGTSNNTGYCNRFYRLGRNFIK